MELLSKKVKNSVLKSMANLLKGKPRFYIASQQKRY
tara:strand:- start:9 stop:116 length:108 start_codon:yes stop_codon:yes gene_type:complete